MEGSERDIILVCKVCGERMVLGGPVAVWRSGGSNRVATTAAAKTSTSSLYP